MDLQEYKDYQESFNHFMKSNGIHSFSAIPMGDDGKPDYENGDYEPHFSGSPCDCCGSTLGGDRIDVNAYQEETKEIMEFTVCIDCHYYVEYGQLDDMTMSEINE